MNDKGGLTVKADWSEIKVIDQVNIILSSSYNLVHLFAYFRDFSLNFQFVSICLTASLKILFPKRM